MVCMCIVLEILFRIVVFWFLLGMFFLVKKLELLLENCIIIGEFILWVVFSIVLMELVFMMFIVGMVKLFLFV